MDDVEFLRRFAIMLPWIVGGSGVMWAFAVGRAHRYPIPRLFLRRIISISTGIGIGLSLLFGATCYTVGRWLLDGQTPWFFPLDSGIQYLLLSAMLLIVVISVLLMAVAVIVGRRL